MARTIIDRFSDYLIKNVAPIDVENKNPLDFTNDAATCSYKVFDPSVDEIIQVDEASGQTVISVSNTPLFKSGQSVEITIIIMLFILL